MTSTTYFGITLYNDTSDADKTFNAFKNDVAGDVSSNMTKIADKLHALDVAVASSSSGGLPRVVGTLSSNTYISSDTNVSGYIDGTCILLNVNMPNSGDSSLKISNLSATAYPLKKINTSGNYVALQANDLAANRNYFFVFLTTPNAWILVSSSSSDQINTIGTAGDLIKINTDNTLATSGIQSSTISTHLSSVDNPHATSAENLVILTNNSETNNATTSKHGFLLKGTAPSTDTQVAVVGLVQGDTNYGLKDLYSSSGSPSDIVKTGASSGTSLTAARKDHSHNGLPSSYLSTDGTLGASSPLDTLIPTQKAVKTYSDSLFSTNKAFTLQAVIDCSGSPDFPVGVAGDVHPISVSGKIGGSSGISVIAGEMIVCNTSTVSGNYATVGANWNILQNHINSPVSTSTSSVSDGAVVIFDGTAGNLIKANTSNNIPNVSPGTTGNIMISNGTNWVSSTKLPIGTVVGTTDTQTMTNKRISKRVVSVTQSATPAINTDNGDIFQITGLAQAITSMTNSLTGTPNSGDMIMIQITDNGTGRAIAWGASFASTTISLPSTTLTSTMLRVLFQRNNANTIWDCIGVV